ELRSYFQREWAHASTTLGIGLLRDRQAVEARAYLWQSLQQYPWNPRSLSALALSYLPQSIAYPFIHLRNPNLLSRAR
ncbi:glycosyltransferase family 2 protein, partial [Leptolyngbya sp. FACHB-36]|nr:glycosyltransferase family 2 protein [Leptolyngbya sp. FACHB-36]